MVRSPPTYPLTYVRFASEPSLPSARHRSRRDKLYTPDWSRHLTLAGVTRRDTQPDTDAIQTALRDVVNQLSQLADRNSSDFFNDISSQLSSFGSRITEMANNLSEQLANANANTPAPAAAR